MIKGVIFDVGGVLAYDVWEHLLCDPPGQPASIATTFNVQAGQLEKIGEDLWREFDKVKGDPDRLELQYWQRFIERTSTLPQLHAVEPADLIALTDTFIRAVSYDETSSLLGWLSEERVRLGICSNNNEFWFRRQRQKLGLDRFFEASAIVLSCHHGITKSDPRLFEISANALSLDPTECVFVDDRMGNVSRAVECGMVGILFPTEQFPAKPQRGTNYLERALRAMIQR